MMASVSQQHNDLSPQGMEDDTRRVTANHSGIAPSEIAVGVIIGRASEYFDFFVYGIASVLVFPAVFFPFAQRLEGTLYAFVVFSFAFIARPIGTMAFMAIQKRFGRGIKLTAALFLLGLSYGQAAGAVTANFEAQFRYTGAALTSDLAWLIGAAFAPLVALGLSARFGLVAVSVYLLSGAVCTLIALRVNRALEIRD